MAFALPAAYAVWMTAGASTTSLMTIGPQPVGTANLEEQVGQSLEAPTRLRLPPLPPGTRADDALCTMLAFHAAAIQHNLTCVLNSVDPEGPHQLRVSLRRLRVLLQTFRPVMRRTINERFSSAARTFGSIAGQLRDADVVIEELIRPAAADTFAGTVAALDLWRQEVRGRVRAQLRAARAFEFAADLVDRRVEWRRSARSALPATDVSDQALGSVWAIATESGAKLPELAPLQLHKFRKDVKALRYGAEIAVAAAREHDAANLARPLKRIQSALGALNDLATLERFDPPLGKEREALAKLRSRLIAQRASMSRDLAAEATDRWRALQHWRVRKGAERQALGTNPQIDTVTIPN